MDLSELESDFDEFTTAPCAATPSCLMEKSDVTNWLKNLCGYVRIPNVRCMNPNGPGGKTVGVPSGVLVVESA